MKKGRNRGLSPREEDQKDRRGSNSSVDSRTVAMQLNEDEEHELISVMEDVRGFLVRGVPNYISRVDLMNELAKVINADDMHREYKTDATQLAWRLIAQAKRGSREAVDSLKTVMSAVVTQLGAKEDTRRQASVKFLQNALEHQEKAYNNAIVSAVVKFGIRARQDKTFEETSKLLPGIFLPYVDDLSLKPIVLALFEQLDTPRRRSYGFPSLLRHQELLGAKKFDELSEEVAIPDRNAFQRMCRSVDEDFKMMVKGTKRRPRDGVSFGLIPNRIINRLLDQNNPNDRSEGAVLLRKELEIQQEDIGLLLPYIASFVQFLGTLLTESHSKVVIHVLECHEILLSAAPATMRQHGEAAARNLINVIMVDSKPHVKIELYRVTKALMKCTGAMEVLDVMLDEVDNKNPRTREDILIYVIFALLTFPSADFDLDDLVERLAPTLVDPKRRVRQGALECLATVASCLGGSDGGRNGRHDLIYDALEDVELPIYDSREELTAAVQTRLSRRQLPRITDEGFVEYGLLIPQNPYSKSAFAEGADVEWIMRGSGSLSKGTISGGGGGQMSGGSTASLRSVKSSGNSIRQGMTVGRVDNNDIDSGGGHRSDGDVFNRRSRVPSIRDKKNKRRAHSESPGRLQRNDFTVAVTKDPAEDEVDQETLRKRWKEGERDIPSAMQRERDEKYDVLSKADSVIDLKAAAATDTRTAQDSDGRMDQVAEENEDTKKKTKKKTGDEGRRSDPGLKKSSLASLGLAKKKYNLLFDDEDGVDDDEAPGAFKRPHSAYRLARKDLKSNKWEVEVDGLAGIVRLVRYHPQLIIADLQTVQNEILAECRNLRSQVARAAVQALTALFVCLGREMETKSLDAIAELLLTKTADTNRFIRRDAATALDALSEHVSIGRVVTIIERVGAAHRNTAARTVAARLLGDMAEALGEERIMRETTTLEKTMGAGLKFLLDGNLDTRVQARRFFAVIADHPDFDCLLEEEVQDRKDLEQARKSIRTMRAEKQK